MVAVAIIGAAAVGGVATYAASKNASKTVQKTADKNNALQADIYGQNKAALSPYMSAGGPATAAIQSLLGLSGPDAAAQQQGALNTWRGATGYQDQFAEGQRGALAGYGRAGMLDSGAALKGLTRYGQSQANQSFGNYYSMLAQQQNVGLTGASALAGVGQNYANATSANNNAAAETSANAGLAGAGAINGVLSSALSAYGISKGMGSSYGGAAGALNPYGIRGAGAGGIY